MSKTILVCLLFVCAAGMTACGQTEDEQTKEAVHEGNRQILAYEKDRSALKNNYEITVKPTTSLTSLTDHYVPTRLSIADLEGAEALLYSLIGHARRAITASQQVGVIDADGLIPKAKACAEDAEVWVGAIDERLSKLRHD